MPGSLLVAGTTSDAGKSVVTTGLCRALARRGVRVAPYKAQNMSNNSMVVTGLGAAEGPGGGAGPGAAVGTGGGAGPGAAEGPGGGAGPGAADGTGEIGRAQWVQALAARVEPEVAMNPVLLKPGGDRRSHAVVMGRPAGEVSSTDFVDGRRHLARAAHDAFDDLADRFDVVVAEGAGSPAEINLRSSDYVNMGLARHASMPVVVVGDIDRGGVFASMFGTVALLEPADQALVAGFVVNKFRGDPGLLAPGLTQLESLTGRRVFGTLPWDPTLWLDSEDALDLEARRSSGRGLRVAVVRLPRISNFTDVDALGIEPGVDVAFVSEPRDLVGADLVVLPGSRATVDDLAWVRSRGLDRAVLDHAAAGRPVLGVCGGFQMLGRRIVDPDGVESGEPADVEGLGLLDVVTTFGADKVLRLPRGEVWGQRVGGYEIHHGRVEVGSGEAFLGGARQGVVHGTMWHGSLESDGFRRAFLARVAASVGADLPVSEVSFAGLREARLDRLGDLVEQHLDVDALLELARSGPGRLPVLPPGGSR